MPTTDALRKNAKYFGMTTDQIMNYDGNIPTEVTTEDKTLL
jgi:hypothetical protein